ncbi:hypothetical protein SLS59_006705 [Nothophoma quercina]|uniref:Uncharacterized protein n=1 Tax=Nothophoma quercina TaxID=749835 RepID=A0ABR3R1V7_9PLEO
MSNLRFKAERNALQERIEEEFEDYVAEVEGHKVIRLESSFPIQTVARLTKQLGSISTSFDDLQNKFRDLTTTHTIQGNLLDEALEKTVTLEEDLEEGCDSVPFLETQLVASQQTCRDLRQQLEALQTDRDEAVNTCARLHTQLGSLNKDHDTLQKASDKTIGSCAELREQLQSLQQEHSTSLESLMGLQTELGSVQADRDAVQAAHDEISGDCEGLRAQFGFLQKDHNALQKKCDDALETHAWPHTQHKSLQQEHAAATYNCVELHQQLDSL